MYDYIKYISPSWKPKWTNRDSIWFNDDVWWFKWWSICYIRLYIIFVWYCIQGLVSETQGWQLKRLLTFTRNRLACRPNRPRDPMLRDYMSSIGVHWPENAEKHTDESESESDDAEQEDSESEDGVDDEIVVPDECGGGVIQFWCMFCGLWWYVLMKFSYRVFQNLYVGQLCFKKCGPGGVWRWGN